MKLLAIDYGMKKIGLAIGDTDLKLAEPLSVLKVSSIQDAVEKAVQVVQMRQVDRVVVGLSGGKMAIGTKRFAKNLEEKSGVNVVFQDETYTTKEAQKLSIEAGIKRSKRKQMEDAYSAALILQNYLDSST